MKAFWDQHKTKIMGAIVALAGSLQANSELLESLLTATQFGWLMVGLGGIITVIGVFNSKRSGEWKPPAK